MVKSNPSVVKKRRRRITRKRMPLSLKRLFPLILCVQDYRLYDPHTLMDRIVRANKDFSLKYSEVLKEINSYLKAHGYVVLIEGNYDKSRAL